MSKFRKIENILIESSKYIADPKKVEKTKDLLWQAYQSLYEIVKDVRDDTLANLYNLHEYLDEYYDKEDASSPHFLENAVDKMVGDIRRLEEYYFSDPSVDSSSDSDSDETESDDEMWSSSHEDFEDDVSTKRHPSKNIMHFYDSSDDEDIVEKNPYEGVFKIKSNEMQA